ncbi:hypothetical protein IMSAGC019_03396 [Lachnospiraceae bacterium]|nr:hypothetical protein IMSAGC019_03396 [Lachnospiraceae bacterium]
MAGLIPIFFPDKIFLANICKAEKTFTEMKLIL